MIIKRDWLWDKKISTKKARAILKNPKNEHFVYLASTLLARKNSPQEVFKYYIKPADFVKYWNSIKRRMRKDSWNDPRIDFWQAIYEKIKEKYAKRGLVSTNEALVIRPQDKFCKIIADRIKAVRKQKGLTQFGLAKKLSVSQQIISRIESGRENVSILTLKKIVDTLGAKLNIDIT